MRMLSRFCTTLAIALLLATATRLTAAQASAVTWPRAGADSRSVSKLSDFASVKDFGVTGDGLTNDTAAMQVAIDSMVAGGTLVVPRGTYRIESAVTWGGVRNVTLLYDSSGVTFAGAGSMPQPDGTNHVLDLGRLSMDAAKQQSSINDSSAASVISTGRDNVFIGSTTGQSNTTGDRNTFVGRNGSRNTTGMNNSFFGYVAGNANVDGANNTCLGVNACGSTVNGFSVTAVGYNAGVGNTSGASNTFLGTQTGAANTTGSFNTYVGSFSGTAASGGQANAYFGYKSGWASTTGVRNTYIGNSAAFSATSATDNTALGYDAGHALLTGGGNTLLGSLANLGTDPINHATVVGYAAVGNADRCTALGFHAHCDARDAIILGEPGNAAVQVGVGTATPDPLALLDLTAQAAAPKALLLPRLSTVQRNALSVGLTKEGYVVWDVDTHQMCVWDSTMWECFPQRTAR